MLPVFVFKVGCRQLIHITQNCVKIFNTRCSALQLTSFRNNKRGLRIVSYNDINCVYKYAEQAVPQKIILAVVKHGNIINIFLLTNFSFWLCIFFNKQPKHFQES